MSEFFRPQKEDTSGHAGNEQGRHGNRDTPGTEVRKRPHGWHPSPGEAGHAKSQYHHDPRPAPEGAVQLDFYNLVHSAAAFQRGLITWAPSSLGPTTAPRPELAWPLARLPTPPSASPTPPDDPRVPSADSPHHCGPAQRGTPEATLSTFHMPTRIRHRWPWLCLIWIRLRMPKIRPTRAPRPKVQRPEMPKMRPAMARPLVFGRAGSLD